MASITKWGVAEMLGLEYFGNSYIHGVGENEYVFSFNGKQFVVDERETDSDFYDRGIDRTTSAKYIAASSLFAALVKVIGTINEKL